MKIAIHRDVGSFSDRWIRYCEEDQIPYRIVDCYRTDIVEQLKGCDCLFWHWRQSDRRSHLLAKPLTIALERMGIRVFPDHETGWHYDDKIAQKYLVEALNIPHVPSYVFYSPEEAIEWAKQTSFPKVFKLRGGAGSVNVRLANDYPDARKLIKKAFNKGFNPYPRGSVLKDQWTRFKKTRQPNQIIAMAKSLVRAVFPSRRERYAPRQIGYAYFQDFIPNNDHDTRLVIVGDRCFGLRRYCRKGDFRASGSGSFGYDKDFFPMEMVREAFQAAQKLKMSSVAFDYIIHNNKPLLIEISYCYTMGAAYDNCPGYWNNALTWIDKPVNPQRFIFDDMIASLQSPRLESDEQ